jgi:hypothetical protein
MPPKVAAAKATVVIAPVLRKDARRASVDTASLPAVKVMYNKVMLNGLLFNALLFNAPLFNAPMFNSVTFSGDMSNMAREPRTVARVERLLVVAMASSIARRTTVLAVAARAVASMAARKATPPAIAAKPLYCMAKSRSTVDQASLAAGTTAVHVANRPSLDSPRAVVIVEPLE